MVESFSQFRLNDSKRSTQGGLLLHHYHTVVQLLIAYDYNKLVQ